MTDWSLLFWVIFCPFTHPKNTQKWEFWKKFNSCCRYHLTHVVVIWCKILEIRSETFRSFCHFGTFFAFLTPNNLLPWVLFLVSVNLKCIVWIENYAEMEDWPPPFLCFCAQSYTWLCFDPNNQLCPFLHCIFWCIEVAQNRLNLSSPWYTVLFLQ